MGIVYQIPHTARYIPAALTFKASFNPLTGIYDFQKDLGPDGKPVNSAVLIEEMQHNTIYIIDRMSIGADIPGEVYTDSINIVPSLNIKRTLGKLQVYQNPITIPTFADNRDIIAWVHSDKHGDKLVVDFSGILNQVSYTVGNTEIRIFCALDLYAIDSTDFGNRFRDYLSPQTGEQVRGSL